MKVDFIFNTVVTTKIANLMFHNLHYLHKMLYNSHLVKLVRSDKRAYFMKYLSVCNKFNFFAVYQKTVVF